MTSKMQPIKMDSLNDECYRRIKESILTGDFGWGQRLDVGKIAEAFGVSKFPVIKALDRLALERLLIVRPNKGTFVIIPTKEDLRELTEVRIMLETTACHIALEKNPNLLIKNLEQLTIQFNSYQGKFSDERQGFNTFLNYDRSFHRTFFDIAGNRRLAEFYFAIRYQSELYRNNTYTQFHRKRAEEEHRTIIDALEKGNLNASDKAIRNHLLTVMEDANQTIDNFQTQKTAKS
jgi:DNA-binding GntR family transcriptional regulator